MRARSTAILTAALLAPLACADGGSTVEEAAASIDEEDYLRKVAVIAHDSMMGRDTPSDGLEMTAAWIAAEFERYGLEPGGDGGTFLQRWPYPSYAQDWEGTTVTAGASRGLVLGEDLAYTGAPVEGGFTGDVVVVDGLSSVAAGGDSGDFRARNRAMREALSGLDLEGRHVLLFPGRAEAGSFGRFIQGAAGVFLVADMDDEAWEAHVAEQREAVRRVYGGGTDFSGTPSFTLRRDAALALLQDHGMAAPTPGGPLRAQPVPGLSLTVAAAVHQVDDATPPNVVGILPGSDPELADEYVIFSAHMDHVGVNASRAREDSLFEADGRFAGMETDSIFNGADDDASGTIAVVEVAEAFSMLAERPRRSMIFLLVSGEEKGLLGSRYYADNPTVPAGSIVANFNTDMIGRNWEDTVVVIGKEHSELGEIMNRVGAAHPELDMAPIDDRWPEQNFYRRSDHFNFARRGVPVLFFFTGVHDDYHQATDEVRKLGGDKAARISKLVFHLSHEVANLDEAPRWYDDSYDEFVTAAPEDAPRRSRPREGTGASTGG